MNFVKLIGIKIDDFSSTIEFEQNYSIKESNTYKFKKKELENNGLVCILANIDSNLKLQNITQIY